MTEPNLTKVYRAFQEQIDGGNPTLEFLKEPPTWTAEEVKYYNRLVQAQMNPEGEADSLYHSQWDHERAWQIAGCITESIHQDFDGWEDRDKVVIMLYLHDLGIALKCIPVDMEGFNDPLRQPRKE